MEIGQKGSLCRQRLSERTIRTSEMVKQKIMMAEIVKKAQYGIIDGKNAHYHLRNSQNGSIGRQRW